MPDGDTEQDYYAGERIRSLEATPIVSGLRDLTEEEMTSLQLDEETLERLDQRFRDIIGAQATARSEIREPQ